MDENRPPATQRAGTKIDHNNVEPIHGAAKMVGNVHGLLDHTNRVYQGGGELGKFVFWKKRLVSLALTVWEQIKDRCDWIEMIDHDRNECYRVDIETAKARGEQYNAGIGPRWGIPLEVFKILLADGTEKTTARLAKKPDDGPDPEGIF